MDVHSLLVVSMMISNYQAASARSINGSSMVHYNADLKANYHSFHQQQVPCESEEEDGEDISGSIHVSNSGWTSAKKLAESLTGLLSKVLSFIPLNYQSNPGKANTTFELKGEIHKISEIRPNTCKEDERKDGFESKEEEMAPEIRCSTSSQDKGGRESEVGNGKESSAPGSSCDSSQEEIENDQLKPKRGSLLAVDDSSLDESQQSNEEFDTTKSCRTEAKALRGRSRSEEEENTKIETASNQEKDIFSESNPKGENSNVDHLPELATSDSDQESSAKISEENVESGQQNVKEKDEDSENSESKAEDICEGDSTDTGTKWKANSDSSETETGRLNSCQPEDETKLLPNVVRQSERQMSFNLKLKPEDDSANGNHKTEEIDSSAVYDYKGEEKAVNMFVNGGSEDEEEASSYEHSRDEASSSSFTNDKRESDESKSSSEEEIRDKEVDSTSSRDKNSKQHSSSYYVEIQKVLHASEDDISKNKDDTSLRDKQHSDRRNVRPAEREMRMHFILKPADSAEHVSSSEEDLSESDHGSKCIDEVDYFRSHSYEFDEEDHLIGKVLCSQESKDEDSSHIASEDEKSDKLDSLSLSDAKENSRMLKEVSQSANSREKEQNKQHSDRRNTRPAEREMRMHFILKPADSAEHVSRSEEDFSESDHGSKCKSVDEADYFGSHGYEFDEDDYSTEKVLCSQESKDDDSSHIASKDEELDKIDSSSQSGDKENIPRMETGSHPKGRHKQQTNGEITTNVRDSEFYPYIYRTVSTGKPVDQVGRKDTIFSKDGQGIMHYSTQQTTIISSETMNTLEAVAPTEPATTPQTVVNSLYEDQAIAQLSGHTSRYPGDVDDKNGAESLVLTKSEGKAVQPSEDVPEENLDHVNSELTSSESEEHSEDSEGSEDSEQSDDIEHSSLPATSEIYSEPSVSIGKCTETRALSAQTTEGTDVFSTTEIEHSSKGSPENSKSVSEEMQVDSYSLNRENQKQNIDSEDSEQRRKTSPLVLDNYPVREDIFPFTDLEEVRLSELTLNPKETTFFFRRRLSGSRKSIEVSTEEQRSTMTELPMFSETTPYSTTEMSTEDTEKAALIISEEVEGQYATSEERGNREISARDRNFPLFCSHHVRRGTASSHDELTSTAASLECSVSNEKKPESSSGTTNEPTESSTLLQDQSEHISESSILTKFEDYAIGDEGTTNLKFSESKEEACTASTQIPILPTPRQIFPSHGDCENIARKLLLTMKLSKFLENILLNIPCHESKPTDNSDRQYNPAYLYDDKYFNTSIKSGVVEELNAFLDDKVTTN